jgi:hypothetical protein
MVAACLRQIKKVGVVIDFRLDTLGLHRVVYQNFVETYTGGNPKILPPALIVPHDETVGCHRVCASDDRLAQSLEHHFVMNLGSPLHDGRFVLKRTPCRRHQQHGAVAKETRTNAGYEVGPGSCQHGAR